MPKITPVSSKITPTEPLRTIKASTDANPFDISKIKSPEAPAATPEVKAEAGQTPTPEGQAPEATEALDPKYEALAKKESAFLAKEKEFKTKEASLDAKIQEAVTTALNEFKTKLKAAPLDVLNEEGLTYDQLVEAAVNAPNPELKSVQSKIEALEKKLTDQQSEAQKREAAQRESAIKQIRDDAKKLVESNPDFETIKTKEASEDVVNLIVKTFDEKGELLTVEDAAKQIEDKLFEEAIKLANTAKVKAKLTPEVVEAAKQDVNKQSQIKTLTNNISSSRPLTAKERAILAFKGELK